MINNIILILGVGLTVILYLYIVIIYFINRGKEDSMTSSELVLKLLDNDASINLIESKESMFSKYNIKRKMVKLSESCYDSKNYFNLAIASLLSGYSLLNNNLLNYLGYVFRELKFISFSPIIGVVVSLFVSNVGDSRIGIVILIIIAIYQYIINMLNTLAVSKVRVNDNVSRVLNKFVFVSKLAFIITLIEIIRLVVIILGI